MWRGAWRSLNGEACRVFSGCLAAGVLISSRAACVYYAWDVLRLVHLAPPSKALPSCMQEALLDNDSSSRDAGSAAATAVGAATPSGSELVGRVEASGQTMLQVGATQQRAPRPVWTALHRVLWLGCGWQSLHMMGLLVCAAACHFSRPPEHPLWRIRACRA